MSQTQRQPVPYGRSTPREIEIVHEGAPRDAVVRLGDDVREIQTLSETPVLRVLRRFVFVWLRIYVHETNRGKVEKVNISIPLPIPLLGATFARRLSFERAARMAARARRGEDVSDSIQSSMGLELIRVDDDQPDHGKRSLVVIGLD